MDVHFPWWVGLCTGALTFVVCIIGLSAAIYLNTKAQEASSTKKRCKMLGCKLESLDLCGAHIESSVVAELQAAASSVVADLQAAAKNLHCRGTSVGADLTR